MRKKSIKSDTDVEMRSGLNFGVVRRERRLEMTKRSVLTRAGLPAIVGITTLSTVSITGKPKELIILEKT